MKEYDPRNMVDGKTIVMYVNDVRVEGKFVSRERWSMEVAITSPYSGFSERTGHLPMQAREFYNWENESGEEKAYEILKGIYNFLDNIDKHKETLATLMAQFRIEREKKLGPESPEKARIDQLKGEIKDHKSRLKAGIIDNVTYQKTIKSLKKEIESIEYDLDDYIYEYFDEKFQEFHDNGEISVGRKNFISYLKNIGVASDEDEQFLEGYVWYW